MSDFDANDLIRELGPTAITQIVGLVENIIGRGHGPDVKKPLAVEITKAAALAVLGQSPVRDADLTKPANDAVQAAVNVMNKVPKIGPISIPTDQPIRPGTIVQAPTVQAPTACNFPSSITVQLNLGPNHQLDVLIALVRDIQTQLGEIKVKQSEEIDVLNQIDTATTLIGTNLQKISSTVQGVSTTAQTIATEVDQLVQAAKDSDVSQDIQDRLATIKARTLALGQNSQLASEQLDAQVPVLNAIATAGASNPVPVPPPTV